MELPRGIFEKLLCPLCGSDNLLVNSEDEVQCINCLSRYPAINGVYSFTSNELREFSEVPVGSRERFIRMKEKAYFKKSIIQRLYTHYHYYAMVKRSIFGRNNNILDIGFGMGEHYNFITQKEKDGQSFLGVDLDRFKLELFHRNHPDVPVIQADAFNLPIADSSFDVVQLLATLEHFNNTGLKKIISESLRVLRRGGIVIVCYPAEGSFLLKSCQKIMHIFLKRNTGFDIENEIVHNHLSNAYEIKKLLMTFKHMKNIDSSFYPFSIPVIPFSLFINEVYEKQS